MVKIAVLVSGGGTNLQAFWIDRKQQGELGSGKICPGPTSLRMLCAGACRKAGIESIVVDRKQCSSP